MDFRVLLERITPALNNIARRQILRGFYSEEDLYQEMCLYLWQNYGQGLPIGKNEGYVIKACEFHIKNFLRKGRPKAMFSSLDEVNTPGGLTLGDMLEDKSQPFGTTLEDKITVDEVKKAGLTEKERSVLDYLLKGHTLRETAEEMGISHVMVLKYKKQLIKKWQKKGYQKR